MEYLTASEIAAKWNVSEQLVRRHCRENRIPDAYQEFGTWYIPADAEKPARKQKEVKPTPILLKKILKQRDGKQYRGFYEYLQINMVYSSGRMASNRLTRNQIEVLYKKDRIFTTSEDIKVNDIDVETMLKNLRREGRSISCLTQCRGMMYQIMNKAEANDLIRKNPVRFAEKMRYREPVKRKDAFTAEEVSILMERLPDDRIGLSIRLMLGTGMRSQELLALEPRHIEPDGSVIHIEQAINMQKGTATIGIPKSRDSYRNIPVPKSLQYCAMALRETDRKYIWEARKVDQPCNPTYFRDQFRKALEAIPEVRLLTPHSCRHTYVSQMQALGVDLSTIQSIVGHADVSMTQHYLHVQESIRMDAVDRFSKAFPTGHSDPDGPDEPSCKVLKFPNVG